MAGVYVLVDTESSNNVDFYLCSGVCSGCGLTLEDGDISPDDLQLLRKQVESTLLNDAKMSADIEAEVVKLDALRRMTEKNKFGAILDGQNIAHIFQGGRPNTSHVRMHINSYASYCLV